MCNMDEDLLPYQNDFDQEKNLEATFMRTEIN
jgi:hypothetical protein